MKLFSMIFPLHVMLCPHGCTSSNAVCYDSIYPIKISASLCCQVLLNLPEAFWNNSKWTVAIANQVCDTKANSRVLCWKWHVLWLDKPSENHKGATLQNKWAKPGDPSATHSSHCFLTIDDLCVHCFCWVIILRIIVTAYSYALLLW